MESTAFFLLAADAVLFLHVFVVAFVVFGLVFIFTGKVRNWSWVRNPWFRLMHLLAIGVIAIQSWFGVICPLTDIEMALRLRAGDATYTGSFISHWLDALLYYQAPEWVFAVCYTAFGAVVAGGWIWVRPRSFSR